MRTRDLFYTALASLLSLGVSLAQDSDVLLAQLEQRRSYRPSSGEIDRLSHAFGIYPTGMGPSEA